MKVIGFIYAAGLGTRLRPHTLAKPKALVRVDGKVLLDNAIEKLEDAGITDIIVNVHHFPDQIIEHIRSSRGVARIRVSDERAYLRDTAGGLKFSSPFWGGADALLLYNVDIISDINIRRLLDSHIRSGNSATLAVRNRDTSRYFIFDGSGLMCGWCNKSTGETILNRSADECNLMAFSGIHVINTGFAAEIPSVEKSSITNFYIEKCRDYQIGAYVHNGDLWDDVGKFEIFKDRLS